MKNYSLYVYYKREPIIVCEDETSANAECFTDALRVMMHQMLQYAHAEQWETVEEVKDFLMYADVLLAILHDEVPYDPETDDDRADPDDACYMIDATEYIDKHYPC